MLKSNLKRTIKVLAIALTTALITFPAANAKLKVYSYKGTVTIKKGNKWVTLPKAEVQLSDEINIAEGAKVSIQDTESNRLYTSVKTGQQSVKALINRAKSDAESTTLNTIRTLLAALISSGNTKSGQFGGKGVSIQQTDTNTGNVTLRPGQSYLSYLMELTDDQDYDTTAEVVIARRNRNAVDGTFTFDVFNTLDTMVYVNVIRQDSSGEILTYFPICPAAEQLRLTHIPEYQFVIPEEQENYILVASEQPFSIKELEDLLEGKPLEQNFYLSLLRP